MKILLVIALFLAQTFSSVAKDFSFGHFIRGAFVTHLLKNHRTEEANLLFEKKNSLAHFNYEKVYNQVKWAQHTSQPDILKKESYKYLSLLHQFEKDTVVKCLVSLGLYVRANNMSRKWGMNKHYVATHLLNNNFKIYTDSFIGTYADIDSLVASAFENKKSRSLATALSIIPGAGKIYLGRATDGLGSLSIVTLMSIQGFEQHASESYLQYPYLTLAALYYIGSIYGTQLLYKRQLARTNQKCNESILQYLYRS